MRSDIDSICRRVARSVLRLSQRGVVAKRRSLQRLHKGRMMFQKTLLATPTTVRELTDKQTVSDDEALAALRWRRAILKLSETLLSAADQRRELSPVLLEAMDFALENYLLYGDEHDLMLLEEWLREE